jgi:hypothetical protein
VGNVPDVHLAEVQDGVMVLLQEGKVAMPVVPAVPVVVVAEVAPLLYTMALPHCWWRVPVAEGVVADSLAAEQLVVVVGKMEIYRPAPVPLPA